MSLGHEGEKVGRAEVTQKFFKVARNFKSPQLTVINLS